MLEKNRRRTVRALIALGSTAVSVPAVAQAIAPAAGDAQQAASAENYDDRDIIVTAQKRSQTLSDVPISVTALSGDQMAERGINDVADLVKVTPGLSFVDTGREAPVFSLRGVGFYDNALGARPTVSVYADEAPLPFSAMARSASLDLERVEVLKGPQGTLFGQSSTGGAINYIAAKPTRTFQGGMLASFGRFSAIEAEGFVSGPISSTLGARVAIRTNQGGAWQYSTSRPGDRLGDERIVQGRILLDWEPSDAFKVSVNINGFLDNSDNPAGQFVGVYRSNAATPLLLTLKPVPRDPRAADWAPGLRYRRNNDFYQGVLRADYQMSSALTLTSLTSYSHMNVSGLIPDGTTLRNFDIQNNGSLQSFSEELRLSGETGRLQYIVGGNYELSKTYEEQRTLIYYSTITALTGPNVGVLARQRFSTIAAFGDTTFSITDKLRLNGGIRYTRQKLDYSGCLATFDQASADVYAGTINFIRLRAGLTPNVTLAPGQCASLDAQLQPAGARGEFIEDNVSWRAGIDFKPVERTLLYFNVSKGYKAGSIPSPGASSVEQIKPVKQESVLAYEAGVKTALFDRKVELTAAGFYYDYKDKQLLGRLVFTPNIFGPQGSLVNIPKSRVIGAEAQLSVRPVAGMTLSAAGTYLDTKVEGDFFNYNPVGVLTNFKNDRFPFTPKWQLVFDIDERIPVSEALTGVFGINASYRTATKSGFGNDPRLIIQDYWLVDIRAGIEAADGRWKAQLFGRNITNTYYLSNIANAGDILRATAGAPATYGIQASVKF